MAGLPPTGPASDVGGSLMANSGPGNGGGSNQPPQISQPPNNAAGSQQQQHCLYGNDPSQGFIKTEYQDHEGKTFKHSLE